MHWIVKCLFARHLKQPCVFSYCQLKVTITIYCHHECLYVFQSHFVLLRFKMQDWKLGLTISERMHSKPGLFCSQTSTEASEAGLYGCTLPQLGLSTSLWGRDGVCEMTKGCPEKSLKKMIVLSDRYYKIMLKREGIIK